jgi:hypothetical protein
MITQLSTRTACNFLTLSCLAMSLAAGCSTKSATTSKTSANEATHQATEGPLPNTTDILSVDQSKGTFTALSRRDHTTHRIVAKCGERCPVVGKNFAGFWSLPPSQTTWVVIEDTEMDGLHSD